MELDPEIYYNRCERGRKVEDYKKLGGNKDEGKHTTRAKEDNTTS